MIQNIAIFGETYGHIQYIYNEVMLLSKKLSAQYPNFQVNRLEYLEETMTLYVNYSVNSIDGIVDAINQLHISFSKQERILSGKQAYWYKNSILGRINGP